VRYATGSHRGLPLYLRKGSAFPNGQATVESGSAAGGEAPIDLDDASVKQSFTASLKDGLVVKAELIRTANGSWVSGNVL